MQEFEFRLEDNLFQLHRDLLNGQYKPQGYTQFRVNDPKPRLISKASVRDRVLHHAIYRLLNPEFDKSFIFDSYSCRVDKGTHKAFARLVTLSRKISRNYTRPCWALKLDVKKFFDTVDHEVLKRQLAKRVADEKLITLLGQIIDSFEVTPGKGMPIGNLTSQLFANVYMDPLDKFVKHKMKIRYYLRYADDILLLSDNPDEVIGSFLVIARYLNKALRLKVHPDKIVLRKLEWGIDFVGYVALPYYQLPRRKTARRILKKVNQLTGQEQLERSLPSYLGYLAHADSYEFRQEVIGAAGLPTEDELLAGWLNYYAPSNSPDRLNVVTKSFNL